MKILICGGAGFIGSHLCTEILRSTKHEVIIADSLATANADKKSVTEKYMAAGHPATDVPAVYTNTHTIASHLQSLGAKFEEGDVRNREFLDKVFVTHKPDAVVHMCASISVPESMTDPLGYYDNNVVGSLRILQAMKRHGCKFIVFSSTAAVFGTPDAARKGECPPVEADAPTAPESVYGDTKLVMEWMLRASAHAYGIKYVALRYFNAGGALEKGRPGQVRVPRTHLLSIVLEVALGERKHVSVFGNDYPTRDGTGVRDFIHVTDLATAHFAALKYLEDGGDSQLFNLGCGKGFSVREVIEMARKVTGHPIPEVDVGRRPGDVSCLTASPAKAQQVLGWTPKYDLKGILNTAWEFMKQEKIQQENKL